MTTRTKVFATALLMCLAMVDQAFAGFFHITPAPTPPPPPAVPEFDGTGAVAAIALLVSIGAVLLRRSRSAEPRATE
jgi:hypothetical protein